MKNYASIFFILIAAFGTVTYGQKDTIADKNSLFQYIKHSILERNISSIKKNNDLGIDLENQIEAFREEFVTATTDSAMYFSLLKISNLRRDSHLRLKPLFLPKRYKRKILPITFGLAYEEDNPQLCIDQIARKLDTVYPLLEKGDRLIAINDKDIDTIIKQARLFMAYSTEKNYHYRFAKYLSRNYYNLSTLIDFDNAVFRFQKKHGEIYDYVLPYRNTRKLSFPEESKYDGFDKVLDFENFNVYEDQKSPLLLLDWFDFEKSLPDDVDSLVVWAIQNNKRNHHVIIDARKSSGGTNCVYALRRLSSKPFKIVKGNIKISDITSDLIRLRAKRRTKPKHLAYARSAEIDDGSALINWLHTAVRDSLIAGASYSNEVVFKMKYKTQNDTIFPAKHSFAGKLIIWPSPRGGSQLDQFASLIKDNQLGVLIGMPAGGYSNTWEWVEPIRNLHTGNIICEFKYSIGHTIRANGEVLEGNPAAVDIPCPPSLENFLSYDQLLIEVSKTYLESVE